MLPWLQDDTGDCYTETSTSAVPTTSSEKATSTTTTSSEKATSTDTGTTDDRVDVQQTESNKQYFLIILNLTIRGHLSVVDTSNFLTFLG